MLLYKVVLTFESVDEILSVFHLNESDWAVFSCGAVYCAASRNSKYWVYELNPVAWPIKWNRFNFMELYVYIVATSYEEMLGITLQLTDYRCPAN